jgi:hypothetical protein
MVMVERAREHVSGGTMQDNVAPTKDRPWLTVMTSFGRFVAATSGVPGGSEAVDCAVNLIKALEGTQDAQSEVLNAIHADVELLRLQAFRGGQLRLDEAARVGPGNDRYDTLINEASSHFLDAESMCETLEEKCVNELHLGLSLCLLNHSEDALYWLKASAASGSEAAQVLAKEAGNVKVLKSKTATALAVLYYPAGAAILLRKRKKLHDAHAATQTLADFLPIVNTAAHCHNGLTGDDPLPAIGLTKTGRNKWTLQEGAVA